MPDGHLGATGPVTTVSYIRDFDVEIASGSIVGDPIVGRIREGWRVHARPHLLSDGTVLLESLFQTATMDQQSDLIAFLNSLVIFLAGE